MTTIFHFQKLFRTLKSFHKVIFFALKTSREDIFACKIYMDEFSSRYFFFVFLTWRDPALVALSAVYDQNLLV